MSKKQQGISSFLGFTFLLFLIWFGGPWLSQKAFESEKKSIDENGVRITAIIDEKRQHKGHMVYFKYNYKATAYRNHEQDGHYYKIANVGDSIHIKIDTLSPSKSYIMK